MPFWVVWWVVSQYSFFFFLGCWEDLLWGFSFFQAFCPTLHILQALQLNFSCWGRVSQRPISHTYLGIWFSTWQRGENSLLQEDYWLCLYGECYFYCFVNLVWKIELTILFCSWHTIIVLRRTIFILFIYISPLMYFPIHFFCTINHVSGVTNKYLSNPTSVHYWDNSLSLKTIWYSFMCSKNGFKWYFF